MKLTDQKLDYFVGMIGCGVCGFLTISLGLLVLIFELGGVIHMSSHDPGAIFILRLLLYGFLPTVGIALLLGSCTMWRYRKAIAFT